MTADGLFDLEDALGTSDPETGSTIPSVSPPCPPGHDISRNGHHIPQVAGRDLPYAFDWSTTRGVTCVDPQGFTIRTSTLAELFRCLPRGVTVVGESTFDSYDVPQRQADISLAESRGLTFLTVPARGNTARRAAAGLSEKTSQSKQVDREDALAIQHAAVNGAHLKVPGIVEAEWAELRGRAGQRLMRLRRSGGKDDYARDRMRHLPPFSWQPTDRRIALGPVENYNTVIVAAVGVAAEFVSERAAFERLIGLYAHGYPSQFRSDLMHWGWGRQPRKRERIRLTVYRRELRWLFHQLRSTNGEPD